MKQYKLYLCFRNSLCLRLNTAHTQKRSFYSPTNKQQHLVERKKRTDFAALLLLLFFVVVIIQFVFKDFSGQLNRLIFNNFPIFQKDGYRKSGICGRRGNS